MDPRIKKIILGKKVIEDNIRNLGSVITNDYSKMEQDLVVVCVLNGAIMFFSELIKNIDLEFYIDTIQVSSYGDGKVSNSDPKIVKECDIDVKDKCVIIADDVLDSGNTMRFLYDYFTDKGVTSVYSAVLLDKGKCSDIQHYACFDCPDSFIVGYGLDYAQQFRHYPFIAELES